MADPRRNGWCAASGVDQALDVAPAGIDAIYATEHVNAYHADVAFPANVQEFWSTHG